MPVILMALVGAAFVLGLNFTGKSATCAGCHDMAPYAKSLTKGRHRTTACVDCHQDPGLIGALVQRAEIVKNYSLTSIYFQRQRPSLASSISVGACLKCHAAMIDKTVVGNRGIKVRHTEIVEAGLNCGRCHQTTAHKSKAAAAKRPLHDYCFACHQGSGTPAKCSTCHTRDIGDKGPRQVDNYRKIDLNLNKCDGCHPVTGCPSCHPNGRQLETY